MRRSSRAGLTLLELAISVTLLAIVLGVPGLLLTSSQRAYSTGATVGELDAQARRALDQVAERLARSGLSEVPQSAGGPNVGWTAVDFREATGWAGGGIAWGGPQQIRMQLEAGEVDDGLDNDGDELIDEQRLIWIEDFGLPGQRSFVLCTGVREAGEGETPGNGVDDDGDGLIDEGGFNVRFDGERVLLELTLERRDSFGVVLAKTARRVVALRN